jgi:hypothetical protein
VNSFRPYKFLIVPVIQEVDDEENVIGESSPQVPEVVFGVEGLHRYADEFEHNLNLKTAAAMNGTM